MHLIHGPLSADGAALPEVAIPADRRQIAKRRWRATADDGAEFGFELETPLQHGDPVWTDANARYVVRQRPEPVLEIALDGAPAAAAVVGWAVGNLHATIDARPTRMLVPDEPGMRQSLDRLGIGYRRRTEVLHPHRLTGRLGGHAHVVRDAVQVEELRPRR